MFSFVLSAPWSGVFSECIPFGYDEEGIALQVVVVYGPFGQPAQPSFRAVGAEVFLDSLVCLFPTGKLHYGYNSVQKEGH